MRAACAAFIIYGQLVTSLNWGSSLFGRTEGKCFFIPKQQADAYGDAGPMRHSLLDCGGSFLSLHCWLHAYHKAADD